MPPSTSQIDMAGLNFKPAIENTSKALHPTLLFDAGAIELMNSLIQSACDVLVRAARAKKRKTLGLKCAEDAVNEKIHGDLGDHAAAAGTRAATQFKQEESRKEGKETSLKTKSEEKISSTRVSKSSGRLPATKKSSVPTKKSSVLTKKSSVPTKKSSVPTKKSSIPTKKSSTPTKKARAVKSETSKPVTKRKRLDETPKRQVRSSKSKLVPPQGLAKANAKKTISTSKKSERSTASSINSMKEMSIKRRKLSTPTAGKLKTRQAKVKVTLKKATKPLKSSIQTRAVKPVPETKKTPRKTTTSGVVKSRNVQEMVSAVKKKISLEKPQQDTATKEKPMPMAVLNFSRGIDAVSRKYMISRDQKLSTEAREMIQNLLQHLFTSICNNFHAQITKNAGKENVEVVSDCVKSLLQGDLLQFAQSHAHRALRQHSGGLSLTTLKRPLPASSLEVGSVTKRAKQSHQHDYTPTLESLITHMHPNLSLLPETARYVNEILVSTSERVAQQAHELQMKKSDVKISHMHVHETVLSLFPTEMSSHASSQGLRAAFKADKN